MDGNGRWAQRQQLPRVEGHRRGVRNVRRVLEAARDCGIEVVTLFAFSVENWKRPAEEVEILMNLLRGFLKDQRADLHRHETRLKLIGRIEELPADLARELRQVEAETACFTGRTLALALNYGSRSEVVDAAKALVAAAKEGEVSPDVIDWNFFSKYLYTADLPDPDLLIRTSGESRISNFLLLQSAYSELYFSPVCWPDFDGKHLREALAVYHSRERRFGCTGEQLRHGASQLPVSL